MKNSTMSWLSAQMFRAVHGNNLVYNACWEDPAVDRLALTLRPSDRVMMITSAGCNALDYALMQPKRICAVDMNPRQNALLELKIAGIKTLDFETFFSIFGRGRIEGFEDIYSGLLRPRLSPEARRIWDGHTEYFSNHKPGGSFYFRGSSGRMARWMNHYIDLSGTRSAFGAILNAGSIEEQKKIYDAQLRGPLWNKFIRWFISTDASLSFVGVPRPQRQQVEHGYVGGIAKFIEDCVEYVFTRTPMQNNYFWSLYLLGQYSYDRCPEYLKKNNFLALKSGLVDSITTHTGTITAFLNGTNERFSKFVLLDHMDWLSTRGQNLLAKEWQAIFARSRKGARAIWRSGGLNTDFVDALTVSLNGASTKLGKRLDHQRELADRLHKSDRVHTYGSFHIADLLVN